MERNNGIKIYSKLIGSYFISFYGLSNTNTTFGTIFDFKFTTFKFIKMKISSFIAATMVLSISLFCSQTFAQSSGVAADKQKQGNLEKIKAHQKEMNKKYNSLSPEEKKQAEARAKEYKKSGGKKPTGTPPDTKPAVAPSTKTTPASSAKPTSTIKPKSVLKGQPVPAGTKAAQPARTKTGTSKSTIKTPAKTSAPAEKAPETEKK